MQNPLQQISFLLQKSMNATILLRCYNSILYRYILLLPKLIDAIVVNNIEQYVVAASFFAANYLLVAKLIVAPVYVFVAI